MLKLFILMLTLFSTLPTFAMRAITSRLQQRGYATMTKENFTKLVEHQANDYPLSPNVFAYELATIKKDNEDLETLWKELYSKVRVSEHALEHNDPSNRIELLKPKFLLIGPSVIFVTLWLGLAAAADPSVSLCFIWKGLAVGVLFSLPNTTLLSNYLKRFSYTNKVLQGDKLNLAHVASLIEGNGGTLPWSKLKDVEVI